MERTFFLDFSPYTSNIMYVYTQLQKVSNLLKLKFATKLTEKSDKNGDTIRKSTVQDCSLQQTCTVEVLLLLLKSTDLGGEKIIP